MWYRQDRLFPRLKTALQKTYLFDEEEEEDRDIQIAKAACVKDVCVAKPEKGLHLIALLSGIFNSQVLDQL